jgi:hypothetical protein
VGVGWGEWYIDVKKEKDTVNKLMAVNLKISMKEKNY